MRRANGTGSIVKLPGARRRPWAVRVPYRTQRGRVRQKYLAYFAKAADAQAALDEWCRTHAAPEAEPMGPASAASHRASWGRVGVLAGKKMRRITLDDWQAIIDQDESSGLSQSSINNDKSLMSALSRFAMQRDIILKDYTQFVKVPAVGAKARKGVLTDLQLHKLEQMAADGVPWADTVIILCYTGFRISEFLELTRFAYHADGDYLQGGKKTAAGRDRIVPVHPHIRGYLSDWLARGGDYIISFYRARFAELMAQIGAEGATPHWCRHTFATRCHQYGVDELAAKRMLGHADKDITEHYTHTDLDYLRQELQKVA